MSDPPMAVIRPMTAADIDAAGRVQVAAFDDLGHRMHEPPSQHIPPDRVARIAARHQHFLTHDPGGAFVATVDDQIVGSALALKRDSLWGLSLLVVDPAHQSGRAGRRLLDAALGYAAGCSAAVILSSIDVRAMRAYATSGFDLHPQVSGTGAPQGIPALDGRVRDGSATDYALMDAVDIGARGAPHGPDHALLGEAMTLFVVDDADGRGYVWVRTDGEIFMLAASDDVTATALLWRAFGYCHDAGVVAHVEHLNAEQQWAIKVAYAARLEVKPGGPVFWRGRTPPTSYLASGAYL